jgi:uncharacterized protein (TIGR02266 family)
MTDNQRQHDRKTVNKDFESIEDFVAEYVTNVSHGGVFIRSKNPLPVGTKVNLKFSIIVEDFETIEGEGEVVRVDLHPDNMGMGVQFTKLTSESAELIKTLVDAGTIAK